MSYARKRENTSQLYANVCESLRASKRYKGYSIIAGEYLMDLIKSMPVPRKKKTVKSWSEILEEKYPANYWKLMQKDGVEFDIIKQSCAWRMLSYLRQQKKRWYLTFEGERFQVSSMALAVDYLRAIIPADAWDFLPHTFAVRKQLRSGKRAVFYYGENKAIIERGEKR